MKSLSGYIRTRRLKARLEKPPVVVRQHVEGVEISFAVHTWLEYHNRARDSYTGEPDMVEFIKNSLKKGDVLWDVGANVGAYSLLAAKIVPEAKVVAIEPYIPTFAHLWDNIALNNCNDRIIPLCVALSDHTSLDFLGISDPRAGSSEHALGDKSFDLIQPSIAIKGDDALTFFSLKAPTLVKIDVDGYETHVLKGMTTILQNVNLRSLIIELDKNKTEDQVLHFMSEAGFEKVSDSSSITKGPVFNTVYKRKD